MFERYPTLREVIVNTRSDKAFRGVLWKRTRGYLILRNVTLLRPREAAVAVDGEVLVDAQNVDFIQIVTSERRDR